MRTKSAADVAIIDNPHHRAVIRVHIYNPSGTSFYELGERVMSVEISEDVDGPRTATVRLFRQEGQLTLSPLIVSAGLAPFGTDPVVAVGRRLTIFAKVTPPEFEATGATDLQVFDGYVDEVAWPDDVMEVVCTDKMAKLRDTWIERERCYGLCQGTHATKGAYVWSSTLPPLAVGDLVIPSEANRNGRFYRVTAATSPQWSVEPTWPTTSGGTVTSGGVTFTESGSTSATAGVAVETLMQQILNDNGLGSLVTLQTPVSPGWNILPYLQERMSVMDALRTLADQLGWSLRFEWNTSLARYELTLREPPRTATTPNRVLSLDDVHEVTEVRQDVFDIRNVVRITYSSSGSLDAEGNPVRVSAEYQDSASVAKYGRRFMEIAESDASHIDTAAEAQRMAGAILSDLSEPTATVSVALPVDPFIELGDIIELPANNLHWSVSTKLAVVALTHSFDANGARTKLTLRGKPAARLRGWHQKDGRANKEDIHRTNIFAQSGIPTINIKELVGGARIKVENSATGTTKDAARQYFETHVSDTSSFTPSASTLVSLGADGETSVGNLIPGKTYYARIVPVIFNASRRVRGEPSAPVPFVAGRAKMGHYDSGSTQSHLPLNGNFEHATRDLAVEPPDHWELSPLSGEAEAWGSSGSVYYGTDSDKGRFIRLRPHASRRGSIISSPFEVRRGIRSFNIYLSIRRNGESANVGKDLIVDIFGFSDAALTNQIINYSVFLSGSASGPYPETGVWYDTVIDFGVGYGTIPTNVNFLQIRLRRGTAGDSSFSWDVGNVYVQEADFHRARMTNLVVDNFSAVNQPSWIAPTFATNWGNVGGVWMPAGYRKLSTGEVMLRGLVRITTNTLTTLIFTLPTGYRPSARLQFPVRMGTNALSYVEIRTDGGVHYAGSGGGNLTDAQVSLTLDGIIFDTQ
jgi:hypothetical protein